MFPMRRSVLTAFLFGIGSHLLIFQAYATIDATLQKQLGNPSNATTNVGNHAHLLIQRAVEALDYSDNLNQPAWASWDLTAADIGSATRSTIFFTDTNLPAGYTRITTADYVGVGAIGFNRGHLCPSADRTASRADNDAVFFMSNIMPQSAANNQSPWGNFETFCRAQLSTNELLIICGPSGFGTNLLPLGKVFIPSNTWKIVVAVPLGAGTALSRLNSTNRVMAISIPNATNALSSAWQTYLTSPRQIELDTGLIFFSALAGNLADEYRARIDGALAIGITNLSPVSGSVGSSVVIKGTNFSGTLAVRFNGTNAAFTLNSSNQITASVPAGASTGPVSVAAAGGVSASAVNFTVTATVRPGFQSYKVTPTNVSLVITGTVANSYTISAATNLANANWTTILITNPAALPFTFVDTNKLPQRFYRVQNP